MFPSAAIPHSLSPAVLSRALKPEGLIILYKMAGATLRTMSKHKCSTKMPRWNKAKLI